MWLEFYIQPESVRPRRNQSDTIITRIRGTHEYVHNDQRINLPTLKSTDVSTTEAPKSVVEIQTEVEQAILGNLKAKKVQIQRATVP